MLLERVELRHEIGGRGDPLLSGHEIERLIVIAGEHAALLAVGVAVALVVVAILALVPVRSGLADKLRPEVEAALKQLGATD